MPGLINKSKRSALPLSVSDITSCVRGYTLAMTASLTYENIEDHPVEGLFLFPLDEGSLVVGFEAMIGSRILTLQVKDKTKIDDCYFDCCGAEGDRPSGGARVFLDEDQERTVLAVSLGLIPALETVSVLVSTSTELHTLPSGGIRVHSPAVCSPRVQRSVKEEQAFSPASARRRSPHRCAAGPREPSGLCVAALLDEDTINSIDYEFNFRLEIRGPYLLAGVESPTHAIRADAEPSARSASCIVVTLADKYTYDCPVEILIHPSEPHVPHVLLEDGDMRPQEYDEHLRGRSEYIRASKRESGSRETSVEVIRKRLHKDLLHNPVAMLNFCPDLRAATSDLRRVQGEFVFLIDRSGSMSGVSIARVKDAMLVILKSLFPACMFNIVGFGSKFKTLFSTSQSYDEESLALACDHVKRMRADMGGTNLQAPLRWVLRQPLHRGHPRLLFLLTDGAVRDPGRAVSLLRQHTRHTRCFAFGIGPGACSRLISGLSSASRGAAEFLAEGERLQPKMIKWLKKCMTAALTDVSIEWLFPETKEILLSPAGSTCLFPGDRLIGYSVVCDTSRHHANPRSDKRRRYSMMRSHESGSSVFFHSQEEEAGKAGAEARIGLLDQEPESRPAEQDLAGSDTSGSPRRRAYSTNQIVDYNPLKKSLTPSDPSAALTQNPLRRAGAQELLSRSAAEHGEHWRSEYQPQLVSLCAASTRGRPAVAPRAAAPPEGPVAESGSRSSTDSPSLGDAEGYTHQLCEAVTPQDPHAPEPEVSQGKGECKVVISGLLCGKPVKWEVTFDIEPYLNGREREEKVHEDLWNETFHHLAGRSIIQDFEHMADRECEIEHGSGRRYQLYAIHTSKACNILSKYTAFVPIDLDSNEYLPTGVEFSRPGEDSRRSPVCSGRRSRGVSVGLGRSSSGALQDHNVDDGSPSPCKTPSSSSWERGSSSEASGTSERSVESLFSASKLSLSRTRLLTRAARGFMSRSQSRSGGSVGDSDADSRDYIPLVSLQLACGAFLLDGALCGAIGVPMDKLKWTSPFSSHRISLAHGSPSGSRRSQSLEAQRGPSPPARDERSSGSTPLWGSGSLSDSEAAEPEAMLWATAVALAWLEHSSASFFIEWELTAAKASLWMDEQSVPEGRDLASVKAAANQLFIILRHWDENLQLNMLCYNPNSV